MRSRVLALLPAVVCFSLLAATLANAFVEEVDIYAHSDGLVVTQDTRVEGTLRALDDLRAGGEFDYVSLKELALLVRDMSVTIGRQARLIDSLRATRVRTANEKKEELRRRRRRRRRRT